MQTIIPAIWFDQDAGEAFGHYAGIFPSGTISKSSPVVTEATLMGVRFIGINGGPLYKPNPAISFMVICEDRQEVDAIWNALSEGGVTLMPLDSYPWSPYYGWIQDRYGVSWQLYLGNAQETNGQRIIPTLMYCGPQQGNCLSAMDHYQSLFRDYKSQGVLLYAEGDMKGQVQHTQFIANGFTLMAMDSGVPQPFTFTEGISLTILCTDQQEINYYWDKITRNGSAGMCGWCKDTYGVSWQIVPANMEQYMQSPAAAKALMQMKKIIIKDLEQA